MLRPGRRPSTFAVTTHAVVTAIFFCLSASPAAADRDAFEDQTEFAPLTGALYLGDVIASGSEPVLALPEAYLTPIDRMEIADGATVGLRLTRHLSQRVSAELLWAYTFSELLRTGATDVGPRTTVHDRMGVVEIEAAVLVHPVWVADGRVGPFVRVGGGRLAFRPANDIPARFRPVATNRTASWMASLGAGVVAYPTEDLSVRAEYGYSRASVDRNLLLGLAFPFPTIDDDTIDGHRFRIGVGLRFFDTSL